MPALGVSFVVRSQSVVANRAAAIAYAQKLKESKLFVAPIEPPTTTTEAVFAPGRRALTIGLVLTVTLVGFESLAVTTALPQIKSDLHGLTLYGWVITAYMLGTLLGSVFAGHEADRRGPATPFAIGITVFIVGLIAAGAAPTMWLLVVARFVQGCGGGAIPAMTNVVAGRGYPEALRSRVFAIMSTAWVVPGMIGPGASAFITEHWGWRWVFLALLPIAIPCGFITTRALRALDAPVESIEALDIAGSADSQAAAASQRHHRVHAVVCTLGVAMVFVGTAGNTPLFVVPFVLCGAVLGGRTYLQLVPRGTVRLQRGLPLTIAMRGFQTFALFGFDAFVPYLFHDVRGRSLGTAGLAVTLAVLTWTFGAWIQERLHERVEPATLIGSGLALVAVGGAGLIAAAFDGVPLAIGVVGYGISALGMGIGYSAVSVAMLSHAAPGTEGAASSALSVTDVLFIAIATGIGGACIHFADAQHWAPRWGVVLAYCAPMAAAITGVVASRRLRT